MKKIIQLLSLLVFVALCIGVSSCKKDDEPPPAKPKLSFLSADTTVNEADGTIEIAFSLDKPASEDIVVDYSLNGTATDKAAAGTNEAYDYEILSTAGEVEIAKGETTGTIEIKLYSDLSWEDTETIIMKIEDVDSENIEITRDDDFQINVVQEDGLVIVLDWPAPDAGAQADMDILLRVGANITTWDGILTSSTQAEFSSPEVIFVPKIIDYAAYGLSYVYYEGTLDPLEFTATFADLINGEVEPEADIQTFAGTYTAANKTKWAGNGETIDSTRVVQTFKKSGGNITEISDIAIPASGSRTRLSSDVLPGTIRKGTGRNLPPELKKIILKRLGKI